MPLRLLMLAVSCILALAACGGGGTSDRAVPVFPATNSDGSVTTGVLPARFDVASGSPSAIPLPSNLLLGRTPDVFDGTIEIPISDPSAPDAALFRAVNALDGWGTTTPWVAPFGGTIDADTVVAGETVRWFEVELATLGGPVARIVRELTPGVDFVATISTSDPDANSVLLVPLRPLDEITSYMAVLTNGITDLAGNNATPDQTYFIAQRREPLVDAQGQSTDPLLDNATARSLEPLRQLTNAQEAAAASAGVRREDIVVSFVATTQSITGVSAAAASLATPQETQFAPTGLSTAAIGGAGLADILIGVMTMPYYLAPATPSDPTAPLTTFWVAEPGAYIPPAADLGLNPNSTNITFYNPFPVQRSQETIPVLLTVPNGASGQPRPDAGWPVVIFQHGLTGNRTNALAIADALAQVGFASIAIDSPLHGVASTIENGQVVGPEANPFYVENTPFGPIARERTFDVDYLNNLTGAPGPDGFIDASGASAINLQNPRAIRDGNRQASVDLVTLAQTIPFIDFTGDELPDFDGSQIRFIGQSLGAIQGIPFATLEPTVQSATFSVPGGGLLGILLGSPTFAPNVLAGLAAIGIEPGTPDFELFVLASQTVVEAGDPINWGSAVSLVNQGVLLQEVIGDTVIPNSVPGFPLAGTEPLIREMGLVPITGTTQDPDGILGVTRILNAGHGSLLSPSPSLDALVEMQTQAVSFAASNGRLIQVVNPELLQGN